MCTAPENRCLLEAKPEKRLPPKREFADEVPVEEEMSWLLPPNDSSHSLSLDK